MSSPSPDGGLGTLLSSTSGGALNPDGTPNLNVLAGGAGIAGTSSGQVTLWDIPKELQGSKVRIFYDIRDTAAANQTITEGGPRYTPGTPAKSHDVMLPVSQVYADIAAKSYTDPAAFLAIQKALADGNFGTVKATGQFDYETEKALGNALTQWYKLAHGAGVPVDFTQYLLDSASRANALGSGSSGSSSTKLPTYRVDDPTYIRAAAQSAFEAAVGKSATKEQLNAFVKQFQQAQKTYESTQAGGTGTSPDLSTDAMAYAQQQDPQAYGRYQHASYMDALVNMFAPSGSGRPSVSPTPSATGS